MSPSGVHSDTRVRPDPGRDGTGTCYPSALNPDLLPATAKYHVGLPERPEPSAGFDAYVAYLDAMCAHVRGMAVKAGRLYHEAKLAELEGAL